MARDTLTGSRIRERRLMAGLRQVELAQRVDISASYLNLIEHNRRKIGGKLLLNIAQVLDVEASLLAEGAEVALISALREAVADAGAILPKSERVEEFAGRFPAWAALIGDQHRRISNLERTAATLTDRLTHDPHLATSMHEMLSMVTAIRSTAGILADTKEIEPEWRNRFHRNLNEDSQRLAENSQQLVSYLDGVGDAGANLTLPLEEIEKMLETHRYRFDDLADAPETKLRKFVQSCPELTSSVAEDMAIPVVRQMCADARLLPLEIMREVLIDVGPDPTMIATQLKAPLSAVLRRMAALSDLLLDVPFGLVMCDAAGTLMLRKPVPGFPIPRFSSACPKWPLFKALSRPMLPLRQTVTVTGRDAQSFSCYAIAEPVGALQVNISPLYHSFMLIMPLDETIGLGQEVGSTCRVCPSVDCEGRREPSLLAHAV